MILSLHRLRQIVVPPPKAPEETGWGHKEYVMTVALTLSSIKEGDLVRIHRPPVYRADKDRYYPLSPPEGDLGRVLYVFGPDHITIEVLPPDEGGTYKASLEEIELVKE
jgi:hypothetical protein